MQLNANAIFIKDFSYLSFVSRYQELNESWSVSEVLERTFNLV